MADDVYKGLGIKRRKGQGPSGDPAPEPGDPDVRKGLGIKRRSGGSARTPAATPESDEAHEADGKGEGDASTAQVGGPEAASAAVGSGLGNDVTAGILRNHFKYRTELRDKLPERLFQMSRTHGRYTGDGRETRHLDVGFKPALVLYVIPPFGIDEPVKFTSKGFIEPGLHRQPDFQEKGFVVDAPFNQIGEMYLYVAFEDDGQPLEVEGKKGRRARRGDSGRTGSQSLGASLGIKRRKRPD